MAWLRRWLAAVRCFPGSGSDRRDAKGDGSPSGVEGKGYSFGHAFLKRVIY